MKKSKLKDYKTFNEWKRMGHFVMKGEKSKKRDKNGVALFHIDQTTTTSNGAFFMSDGKGNEAFDLDDWENDPYKDPYLFT